MLELSKPYANGRHHPQDRYKSNTVNALISKGYVEIYHYVGYLNGAIRLTEKGFNIVKENNF